MWGDDSSAGPRHVSNAALDMASSWPSQVNGKMLAGLAELGRGWANHNFVPRRRLCGVPGIGYLVDRMCEVPSRSAGFLQELPDSKPRHQRLAPENISAAESPGVVVPAFKVDDTQKTGRCILADSQWLLPNLGRGLSGLN